MAATLCFRRKAVKKQCRMHDPPPGNGPAAANTEGAEEGGTEVFFGGSLREGHSRPANAPQTRPGGARGGEKSGFWFCEAPSQETPCLLPPRAPCFAPQAIWSRGSATLPGQSPGGGTRFRASAAGFSAQGRFPLAVASGESVGCGGYGLGLPDIRFCGLPSAPEGRAGGSRGVPRRGGSHRIPLRRPARHPELRHLLVFVLPSPAARLTLAAP